MTQWQLKQWLDHLATRNTQEIQLGLSRTQEVAHKLDLVKTQAKVITVAGTNGKGSTVTALEMIYHTAGYKVAAYTSPHLIKFNERIRINLQLASDEAICNAFSLIDHARGSIELTYFEMTTLAALWLFKQQKLDLIILEVGLGGKLDATNILDADIAIITTVDFDHQQYLGNTLEEIGYEKAGILREGKPFIYADDNPPQSILKRAKQLKTSGVFYNKEYTIIEYDDCWDLLGDSYKLTSLYRPKIHLKSAAAALVASELLQSDFPINTAQLNMALKNIFIAGRLQWWHGDVSILYDVSHNAQSVRLLTDTLQKATINGKIHAVFSALKDKNILDLILPLKELVSCWYPAQIPLYECPRAASTDLLLQKFIEAEIFVKNCYNSPLIALNAALKQAVKGDLIIVYGSFFTVSHAMVVQA